MQLDLVARVNGDVPVTVEVSEIMIAISEIMKSDKTNFDRLALVTEFTTVFATNPTVVDQVFARNDYPTLKKCYVSHLAHNDDDLREAAIEQLKHDAELRETVVEQLKEDDDDLREEAMQALREDDDIREKVIDELMLDTPTEVLDDVTDRLFEDPTSEIIETVCDRLADDPSAEITEAVIEHLRSNPDMRKQALFELTHDDDFRKEALKQMDLNFAFAVSALHTNLDIAAARIRDAFAHLDVIRNAVKCDPQA